MSELRGRGQGTHLGISDLSTWKDEAVMGGASLTSSFASAVAGCVEGPGSAMVVLRAEEERGRGLLVCTALSSSSPLSQVSLGIVLSIAVDGSADKQGNLFGWEKPEDRRLEAVQGRQEPWKCDWASYTCCKAFRGGSGDVKHVSGLPASPAPALSSNRHAPALDRPSPLAIDQRWESAFKRQAGYEMLRARKASAESR